jgi:arylformamidase
VGRTIDITVPLSSDVPLFPGDPAVRVTPVRRLDRGDPYNLCSVSMGSHSGTHVDAPSHFLANGATIDRADLDLFNGPARVVEVPAETRWIGRSEMARVPEGSTRVLFRTSNSDRWARGDPFFPDYVALTSESAELLLERGVRLVGVDAPSVESDPTLRFPVHHRLLAAGTWIIEGLRLSGVAPGMYDLSCLPLPLVGADGAPCRAILRTG